MRIPVALMAAALLVGPPETRAEQPTAFGGLQLAPQHPPGHAAEQQAGCQGQPLAFLQALLHGEQGAVDHHRTGDQYASGAENTAQFNALAGEFDGAGIQLENDEKQQKRDEIDELFHGSSQEEDVAA